MLSQTCNKNLKDKLKGFSKNSLVDHWIEFFLLPETYETTTKKMEAHVLRFFIISSSNYIENNEI